VAHLVAREDGPFDIIVRLRARVGDGVAGGLMDCPYCLGLWIAMPFAWWMADSPAEWLAGWLGVSGGASLVQRLAERESDGPPPAARSEGG
jgi:hypothetical protein